MLFKNSLYNSRNYIPVIRLTSSQKFSKYKNDVAIMFQPSVARARIFCLNNDGYNINYFSGGLL